MPTPMSLGMSLQYRKHEHVTNDKERKLAIITGWMGAKESQLKTYVHFYNSHGFDTLSFACGVYSLSLPLHILLYMHLFYFYSIYILISNSNPNPNPNRPTSCPHAEQSNESHGESSRGVHQSEYSHSRISSI